MNTHLATAGALFLTLTLSMGCGAPEIEADDQEAGEVLVTPELDDREAMTYVPDAKDSAELDRVDAFGDDELEQVFGLAREAQRCRAMRLAKTQIGVRESGCEDCGTPLSRYVRHFYPNMGPQPWCTFFVSWAIDKTDNDNHKVPWPNPGYAPSIHAWAQARGRIVSKPQPCDIFLYGDFSHAGFVTSVNHETGSFRSVEGNYSDQATQVVRNYKRQKLIFVRY